jgi:hypothetical protein
MIYPEFPGVLRRYLFTNFKEKNPKPLTKKCRKIRLSRSRHHKGGHFLIYPEFEVDGKWYVLRKNTDPVVFLIRQPSINGVAIGSYNSRVNLYEKALEKWCREFIAKNNLSLKFPVEKQEKEKITPPQVEIPIKKVVPKVEEEEVLDEVEEPDNNPSE